VANLGDMIPRWTNDLYHSNPHLVRNTHSGGQPRYSIPFFYEPEYTARIAPMPGTMAPGTSPCLPPCTAGEHLREMYLKTYARPRQLNGALLSGSYLGPRSIKERNKPGCRCAVCSSFQRSSANTSEKTFTKMNPMIDNVGSPCSRF
jgi:hypothetical protein